MTSIPEPLTTGLIAAGVAVVATPLLAALAPRLGWADGAVGELAVRKHQNRPVPAVGGAVLLLAATTALFCTWGDGGPIWIYPWKSGWESVGVVTSLAGIFLVGLLDDLRPTGLSTVPKVVGQALALLPAAVAFLYVRCEAGSPSDGMAGFLLLFLGGMAAVNALNTFDNADGALGALCVLGFAWPASAVAGAVAGFLPWNLNAKEGGERDRGATPTAYLGDAGSHVLGYLVVLVPLAWPVLVLPVLDLARLSVVRLRAGSRPWIGDRRHLAHRLAGRGLRRPVVAGLLALIAAPACAAGPWSWQDGAWSLPVVLAGVLGTLVLFLAALAWTSRGPASGDE